jgi:outer membrane protein assembly factor BamB
VIRLALFALAALALTAFGAAGRGPSVPAGTPRVVAQHLADWPAPNHDPANTRDGSASRITAATAPRLQVLWRYTLPSAGYFGSFSSNPVVAGNRVYIQLTNSTVVALDRKTGKRVWSYFAFDQTAGPNGPALGDGVVVAVGSHSVFALDAATGHLRWRKDIARDGFEDVTIAPLIWNGLAIVSSSPGDYRPGGKGIVYALDLKTGDERWHFDTTTGNLWGNPDVNSGGGLWYTPSVDAQGRIYMGVGNPAPFPGTTAYPDGKSRPGPNLYTDSLVVLNGHTGKLLWYFQAVPHDIRDYDLQEPPILTRFGGRDVVVVGGKMGTVYVLDRASGKLLWKRDVGIHSRWSRVKAFGFAALPVTVYPGIFGGLIAPMAVADGTIYASVLDLCAKVVAQLEFPNGVTPCEIPTGRSELVALDGATGRVKWVQKTKRASFAGATVAGDLVVVASYDGLVSLYARATGKLVRTLRLPSGTNGTPAVTRDELFVGAGLPTGGNDHPALVAYKLR